MTKPPDKSALTLVNLGTTGSEPPRKLGEPGRLLWDSVQSEYKIDDIGGRELLMQACLAADRVQSLADTIDHDGETISTKQGLKAHPCLKDELAARSFVCRTLQRLGVTQESVERVGRPPKSFGWRG